MVGVKGFEPLISAPPAQRFTGLSYTPNYSIKKVFAICLPNRTAPKHYSYTLVSLCHPSKIAYNLDKPPKQR